MRIVGTLLVLSAAGLLVADDAKKDDASALKGKWSIVSFSVNGVATADDSVKDLKMEFEGKTYNLTAGDTSVEKGEYTIDESKSPKTIDLAIKEGDDAGKQQVGLYKIEDGKLTIAFSLPGSKERPTSFKVEAKGAPVVVVMEKVKP